jgi:hypothetical protein
MRRKTSNKDKYVFNTGHILYGNVEQENLLRPALGLVLVFHGARNVERIRIKLNSQ